MRLFIAINFGEEELDSFEAARERLRAQAGRANYSRRENLHLTLAFLGEQPGSRVTELEAAMLAASEGTEEFTLRFERAGRFRREDGDICWLGASLLTTEQGIAINEKTQALDTNNEPIPGLYVTGDMSGSFFISSSSFSPFKRSS